MRHKTNFLIQYFMSNKKKSRNQIKRRIKIKQKLHKKESPFNNEVFCRGLLSSWNLQEMKLVGNFVWISSGNEGAVFLSSIIVINLIDADEKE